MTQTDWNIFFDTATTPPLTDEEFDEMCEEAAEEPCACCHGEEMIETYGGIWKNCPVCKGE